MSDSLFHYARLRIGPIDGVEFLQPSGTDRDELDVAFKTDDPTRLATAIRALYKEIEGLKLDVDSYVKDQS